MLSEPRYPMKAVALLTGLSPDTIRAWERRHGAITPDRSAGSHRIYTESEVERLGLLRRVVAAGHGIGRVAGLNEEALRALLALPAEVAARSVSAPAPALKGEPTAADGGVARVLAAIVGYDSLAADRELARLAVLLPPSRLVREVVLPLLEAVGLAWHEGRLSIGQEHLLSALLRSLLGGLLRLAEPVPGRRPVVLATTPGERHELGLLAVALLAATHGQPVCYLGADTPAADIAAAAAHTRARVVGLSLVHVPDLAATAADLAALDAALAPGVALWLGGHGVARLPAGVMPARAVAIDALDALDAALAALSGGSGRPGGPTIG